MSATPDSLALSPRARALTLTAAITAITLAGVGLSLSTPLISLVLAGRNVSATLIGLNTAVASLATILLAPVIPRIASVIGVGGTLLTALALASTSLAAFTLTDSLTFWFVLRFLFGAAIGTLFVMSEFWIAAAAPEDRRGLVMGIYATALTFGFVAGPGVLALAGEASDTLFFVGSAFFVIGAIPILVAGRSAPAIEGESTHSAWGFMLIAPVATVAGFVFGSVEQGAFAFMALYGQDLGLTTATAATLLMLFAAGNLVSQIPLGWLADRIDRRLILLVCALVAFVCVAALPLAGDSILALGALTAVAGGLVGGLYTVGLALLGARFRGPELANANAAFVMLYSAGMMIGAPFIGGVYDLLPPHGFAAAVAAIIGAYAVLVIVRMSAGKA